MYNPVISPQDTKSNRASFLNKDFVSTFNISTDRNEIWHDRLGHFSSTIIQKVLNGCNISRPVNKNVVAPLVNIQKVTDYHSKYRILKQLLH